jgi:hypothetical protein
MTLKRKQRVQVWLRKVFQTGRWNELQQNRIVGHLRRACPTGPLWRTGFLELAYFAEPAHMARAAGAVVGRERRDLSHGAILP